MLLNTTVWFLPYTGLQILQPFFSPSATNFCERLHWCDHRVAQLISSAMSVAFEKPQTVGETKAKLKRATVQLCSASCLSSPTVTQTKLSELRTAFLGC